MSRDPDDADGSPRLWSRASSIEDPARFDGVSVIGVDEHVWRHTRRGDNYLTVVNLRFTVIGPPSIVAGRNQLCPVLHP